ncbi:hypothetical protein [Dyadobacter sp. Leaf189]|uniref:hypothetical protein n=1 Tax=Dyadobacter sp. Leaf189 TaxID=1736295 RepID=UPI0006F69B26|nr:hypothetical protein [Dyadobacter sp. Leaf189]KQS32616.1 hypothetical protein ASG33_00395 [Dyadobacter sp. Leaf189]
MSASELRAEAIRIVKEIDDNRMEDLLKMLNCLVEQQNAQSIEIDPAELNRLLIESLKQAQQGNLIPNEQVLKEGKEWLTKLNGRRMQGETIPK